MRTSPPPKYTWSDAQLADAVKANASWRDVMRALGLTTTSEGVVRRVRRHADRLGLDVSHFKGTRTWDDAQLKRAVADARCWDDVLTALGLATPTKETRVRLKGHSVRLGLDLSHLEPAAEPFRPSALEPHHRHLREAGAALAASWFALCGCGVLFPVEPAMYDLVVSMPDGLRRVQVKTSTTGHRENGWQVTVGRRPYAAGTIARLVPYDPSEIDFFFIIDGDFTMYLIPSRVIAGRVQLLLRAYKAYVVGNAGGLLALPRARAGGVASAAEGCVGA